MTKKRPTHLLQCSFQVSSFHGINVHLSVYDVKLWDLECLAGMDVVARLEIVQLSKLVCGYAVLLTDFVKGIPFLNRMSSVRAFRIRDLYTALPGAVSPGTLP
jgi:hypothetical protein